MMVGDGVGGDGVAVAVHHLVVEVGAEASYSSRTAPESSCQSRLRWGRRSMTVAMVIAWSSCSTTAAPTSASCSIQKHCSAEEVG
ncbi:hypothetical protein SFUMM280S_05343 [Streptomyces fumanus]